MTMPATQMLGKVAALLRVTEAVAVAVQLDILPGAGFLAAAPEAEPCATESGLQPEQHCCLPLPPAAECVLNNGVRLQPGAA